jgi:hypothetical protein
MGKINIYDFTPLYNEVKSYIKEKQGEKGFINTQDERFDTIYAVVYLDDYTMYDAHVKAVRVANEQIEIIYEIDSYSLRVKWSDEDLKNANNEEWEVINNDEVIYYIPTLLSIANYIEEYE